MAVPGEPGSKESVEVDVTGRRGLLSAGRGPWELCRAKELLLLSASNVRDIRKGRSTHTLHQTQAPFGG